MFFVNQGKNFENNYTKAIYSVLILQQKNKTKQKHIWLSYTLQISNSNEYFVVNHWRNHWLYRSKPISRALSHR